MKHILILTLAALTHSALLAADPGAKEVVAAAAKKLGEQANYSWTATVVVPETAQFKPGPTDGKTEKDGFTHVTMSFAGNAIEVAMKGDKAVITDQDGVWRLAEELENAEGRGRFLGRMARTMKTPATQAADLLNLLQDLKKDGDAYSGELTEEGVKAQLRFGQPRNPKGSAKFWVKDGLLAKIEVKISAKLEFNGNEMDADRATTTEIQKVGETKVSVPAEAKKKLN